MDFKIPTQIKMMQQTIRRFVEEELIPRLKRELKKDPNIPIALYWPNRCKK